MQARGIAYVAPSPLLAGLFAPDVVAVETRQPVEVGVLHADEVRYVARTAPKRAAEFAAGRACARAALAQLGILDFALRVGPDREPLWPAEAIGSITHTTGFCGVVVAPRASIAALGIDVEVRNAVRRELWPRICTDSERQSLANLPPERASELATVVFCVKEAFFKCQYALTHEWLNFGDVCVELEPDVDGAVRVQPQRTLKLQEWQPAPWVVRTAHEAQLTAAGFSVAARPVTRR